MRINGSTLRQLSDDVNSDRVERSQQNTGEQARQRNPKLQPDSLFVDSHEGPFLFASPQTVAKTPHLTFDPGGVVNVKTRSRLQLIDSLR